MKIVLDYGHCLSGYDTGAAGNGYREEYCTRDIGKKVKEKLEKLGHKIIVVSPDYAKSVSESLSVRVNAANAQSPDLSISIHLNAGGGTGSEIYTKGAFVFKEATNILQELNKIGYKNRGIKNGSLFALVGSINISKAMLVECCFIDSANDMKLYNPEIIASAIVKGIDSSENNNVSNNSSGNIPVNTPSTNSKDKYLSLSKAVGSWRVYPTNKSPVIGNEVGFLSPSKYGGLTYKILGNPQSNVYTINTTSFGTVNIYAPRDNDSIITDSINNVVSTNNNQNKKYLNLSNKVVAWRVYPLDINPVIGNEVGSLSPFRYGGLSYEILNNPITNVYTINTAVFGKVNIYAPRDNDSTITASPIY